jgi:anion-transporting  ArsA/GET3 family ATPase
VLHAAMLDVRATFDALVTRHAPTAETRDRILRNAVYGYVSTRLPGVHEYMAMERLTTLVQDGSWDLVVLDTPPTAHALDFLDAPARIAGVLDERVMRWLVLPGTRGGWRVIQRGNALVAGVLQTMLGTRTLTDMAEFFGAFSDLWEGFRARSLSVARLLSSPQARFVLVTTPTPEAAAEAAAFQATLAARGLPFAGFVVNRCTPSLPGGAVTFGASDLGDTLEDVHRDLAARLAREEHVIASLLGSLGGGGPPPPQRPPGAWRLVERRPPPEDLAALAALAAELPSPAAIFDDT